MSLLTTIEVKGWIKITGSGDDIILVRILDSAISRVEDYLNFTLEEATYTDELYDGSGTEHLFPRQFPLTTITSIQVYDGLDSSNDEIWDTWVQGEDYERLIIGQGGGHIIIDGATFPYDMQNIKLTYVAGYTDTTLPAKISKALLDLCHIYYHAIRSDKSLGKTSNVQQAGVGSSTVTYDTGVEKKILDSIASYKLWNI